MVEEGALPEQVDKGMVDSAIRSEPLPTASLSGFEICYEAAAPCRAIPNIARCRLPTR